MTEMKLVYVVVGNKSWNERIFREVIAHYSGKWYYVADVQELTNEMMNQLNPRYIFFLHWSAKVPDQIINNYKCICFHMTDVPYGRGGSPLQNLVVRGHHKTMLTALQMVREFDAGPVYQKAELSLYGSAEEIYIRATCLSATMIKQIIDSEDQPVPQTGEIVTFKRRKPSESRIETPDSLKSLFDFVRMLDADGYPHAFLEYNGYRLEFRRAAFYDGEIRADVTIRPIEDNE